MRIIHSTLDWVRTRAADNSRGILLMAGGTLLTTATLVFIRLLGRDLPTAEIVFLRYAFALFAIAPWILRVGIGNTFATSRLGRHGIRGVIATISTGDSGRVDHRRSVGHLCEHDVARISGGTWIESGIEEIGLTVRGEPAA